MWIRAPTPTRNAASQALAWAAVLISTVYAAFALSTATAYVLYLLGITEPGPGRSAPPLFVLHVLSGALALTAGSLQLQLATRLLCDRRRTHRRIGRTYLWAAWITSLSSLGVAAFFDVSIAAKTVFAMASLLWFATTTVAFLRIRQGSVLQHREWMIRSFSLAFFFVTFSLWVPILAATDLPHAIGHPLAVFLSWSLNLIAAEWWIRHTRLVRTGTRGSRREMRTRPALPQARRVTSAGQPVTKRRSARRSVFQPHLR